jgi:hypothetical protein
LKVMPLKQRLRSFRRERGGEVLRSLTALERINGKSAADFWKEVAGGQRPSELRRERSEQAPKKQNGR